MSDESEKVLGIDRLPIFPLPLVLMPFELLPLHIFEPRYREMLADVSIDKSLFGISTLESETEFVDRPAIGSVGCAAEIRETDTLEDGRSNILTVGIIRYRILEYVETQTPYLMAQIEFFEDESEADSDSVTVLAHEVFELFKRVADAAHRLSGRKGEMPAIPEAPPEQLSFLVSAAFNLPIADKYKMIESRSTTKRLKRARSILRDSVKQVEESAKIDQISRTNGHAAKKIDL